MIRIIVKTDDAGMAGNVGGSVLSTFKSFEIELPELERALSISRTNSYAHAQVIGVEVVAPKEE